MNQTLPTTRTRRRPVVALATLLGALLILGEPFTLPGRTSPVEAQSLPTLEVAAASDLRFALEDISALFERQQRVRVRISFGSSGQLATQIEQGAPFDALFSANEAFVQELARKGLMLPDTVQLYAIGRIVFWVRTASPIIVTDGFAALLDERVRFVAIANPEHAPYGQAAVQTLRTAGAYERVRTKLVLGENISQTLQFVQTGNADIGIVALSLAIAPAVRPTGRYWTVPAYLHRPIRQAAGVTARSRNQQLARALLEFVNGPAGRPVMRRYGFTLPGESL